MKAHQAKTFELVLVLGFISNSSEDGVVPLSLWGEIKVIDRCYTSVCLYVPTDSTTDTMSALLIPCAYVMVSYINYRFQ